VQFGTGFVRLALQTRSPIVPLAFIGGGEVLPTIANLYSLGKLVGAPYIPVTPYLVALPLPRKCSIYYGEPMHLQGDGTEDDEKIEAMVQQVKDRVRDLMDRGRKEAR
jgi:1-acyl-sn-glycerol-3-phosphate acyltransferase